MRSYALLRVMSSGPAPRPSGYWSRRCAPLRVATWDCARKVISGDDEVDRLYLEVERRILQLFALQTPVASELRLLTALLHINLHLERVGDQAVNLAKITMAANAACPRTPRCSGILRRWGRSPFE
jgi:phosphate uptake regulator